MSKLTKQGVRNLTGIGKKPDIVRPAENQVKCYHLYSGLVVVGYYLDEYGYNVPEYQAHCLKCGNTYGPVG